MFFQQTVFLVLLWRIPLMNKTRLAVILGLMGAGYLAMNLMVPFNLPYFVNSATCILALFFPFITKKYRILITGIYQTYRVFMVGLLLSSFKELIIGILVREPPPITELSGEIMVKLLILECFHIPLYGGVFLLMYGLAIGYSIMVISQTIIMYTQPYSIYLVYKRFGIIQRIEKTYPYATPKWWRN